MSWKWDKKKEKNVLKISGKYLLLKESLNIITISWYLIIFVIYLYNKALRSYIQICM